ncbi:MAG: hypothetical protein U0514_04405 [Candidatus Andersenbacteria bacterium]
MNKLLAGVAAGVIISGGGFYNSSGQLGRDHVSQQSSFASDTTSDNSLLLLATNQPCAAWVGSAGSGANRVADILFGCGDGNGTYHGLKDPSIFDNLTKNDGINVMPSLVALPAGAPVVAFVRHPVIEPPGGSGAAKVARWDGSGWGGFTGTAYDVLMDGTVVGMTSAINPATGLPGFAWTDQWRAYFTELQWDGTTWSYRGRSGNAYDVVLDLTGGYHPTRPSLGYQPDGTPHVAVDASPITGRLSVLHVYWNGTDWVGYEQTYFDSFGFDSFDGHVVVSPLGEIHVVYVNRWYTSYSDVHDSYWSGTTWVVGAVNQLNQYCSSVDAAFSASGNLYVTYYSDGEGDLLIRRKVGTQWKGMGNGAFTRVCTDPQRSERSPSLVTNAQGWPAVAWSADYQGNRFYEAFATFWKPK